MNQIYFIGETRGYIYYLDFNSHFPAMGLRDLPVGRGRYYEFKDTFPTNLRIVDAEVVPANHVCSSNSIHVSNNFKGLDEPRYECGCLKGIDSKDFLKLCQKPSRNNIRPLGGFVNVFVIGDNIKCSKPFLTVEQESGSKNIPFIHST